MEADMSPSPEALLKQYEEVCKSYHAITDFRARLLALFPLASGVSSIILLAVDPAHSTYLWSIGVLGALLTLGLGLFEYRNGQRCVAIKQIAKNVEQQLGFDHTTGQFQGEPPPHWGLLREGTASALVYSTVFVGWVLLAVYGA
jgi:hypothetical protein